MGLQKTEDTESRVEKLIETALEADAEDFEKLNPTDDTIELEFTCSTDDLSWLTTTVTAPDMSSELLGSELIYAPLQTADVDSATQTNVADLVKALEEDNDILRVWTTLAT